MHCGYVVKVDQLRKHTNADRLQVATFFGNDTIVSLDTTEGDIGVYFPVGLQLSDEYTSTNNLVRKKDENGNNIGGFLDPDKRNIKAINLRGEKSDGLFMPLMSFAYCYDYKIDALFDNMSIGDQVTTINGHDICSKYIPKRQHRSGFASDGNKTRKHKVAYAPLFTEHADTEQLAYNHGAFKAGDEIEITLKMHGTSQRTGYLPVLKGYKRTFWDKLFRRDGTPIYDYDYVSGTRRVVMEDFEGRNSFYGSNEFREQHHNAFVGKLNKGETVYYEVVGFTNTGASIMATCDNNKISDKNFVKQYGKETVFSYGCHPDGVDNKTLWKETYTDPYGERTVTDKKQSDIYVYRMTMTNEDGFTVEYTPDFMRYRCEQIGVKTVPVLWKGTIEGKRVENKEITPGEWITNIAEGFYDGPDPIGKTHVREGVVVRIVNKPKFCAYKHKNWSFKVLEGIAQETIAESTADIPEDVLGEM